jgi:hypothetical protein
MFRLITELFQLDDFELSPGDRQHFDRDGRVDLFIMYYTMYAIPFDTVPIPESPGSNMPVITRGAFRYWLIMRIIENTVRHVHVNITITRIPNSILGPCTSSHQ